MTAYGNDLDYRDIYLEQLKNLLGPGDAVIGISGSGSSPNVLRGMEYARSSGALTIGFTGGRLSGDQLARHCDICVRVPLTMMEQIEDLHVVCHHAVGLALRERIFEHARTEFVAEALTLPEVGIPDQIQA
jgi:D-sedoheptulose 7-phosphate isomerase